MWMYFVDSDIFHNVPVHISTGTHDHYPQIYAERRKQNAHISIAVVVEGSLVTFIPHKT